MDKDLALIGRALLLSAALMCQRIAAWFGGLAIRAEAAYGRLTVAAHG